MNTTVKKGFIQDFGGNRLLPITRAELVLDQNANIAFRSPIFEAIASVGGEGGAFGLMSPADKETLATLSTSTTADIASKLEALNTGLAVENTPLSFYGINTNDNSVYASKWNITADSGIAIEVAPNTVTFKIDQLENDQLPNEISNKILSSVTVSSIPGANVNNRRDYVANLGYVDDKFSSALGVAAGGLQFKGTLSDQSDLSIKLQNTNGFYIWSGNITDIASSYMENNSSVSVGPGDILIVSQTSGNNKFVHVPSGNEITGLQITSLNSDNGDSTSITIAQGIAKLAFNNVFDVTGDSNGINISLPKASSSKSGYLSTTDYSRFSQAATKSLTIAPILTSGYEIATINVNGTTTDTLYGKDTTYKMSGTNQEISFGYDVTGSADPLFTIKPGAGIAFSTDEKVTTITNNLQVLKVAAGSDKSDENDSTDYLSIANGYIQAKIGSVDNTMHINNGLASADLVRNMITQFATHWITIEHDLVRPENGAASDNLYYGTDQLKEAVSF